MNVEMQYQISRMERQEAERKAQQQRLIQSTTVPARPTSAYARIIGAMSVMVAAVLGWS